MKRIFLVIPFILGIFAYGYFHKQEEHAADSEIIEAAESVTAIDNSIEFRDGDIIFQISKSSQSEAIQLASGSKYSHMGIIYKINNELFVYEAVQPVKLTPLQDWIARGEKKHFVLKRLKNAAEMLDVETLIKMKQIGTRFKNKDYDIYFNWSDDKIYCSELVWKIYKEAAGIEIGKLEALKDFDLSSEIVTKKMKERYGNEIPFDEKVISPAAMFNSGLLVTIAEN